MAHGLNQVHTLRRLAALVSRYELWVLGIAAPFLLFPSSWTWVALGLIVLTWVCRWETRGSPSVVTPMDLPIILLVAMTGVGLWASFERSMSVPKVSGVVLGVALYYGLVNALTTRRSVQQMTVVFLLVILAAAAISLLGTDWEAGPIIPAISMLSEKLPRPIQGLPAGGIPRDMELFHAREVGGAMGLLLPVALALAFLGQGKMRWLAAFAALITGVSLVLSQSPNAWAGVAIALAFILAYGRPRVLLLLAALGVLAMILAWSGPAKGLFVDILDPSHRLGGSMAARLWFYWWGLYMLGEMPFTGIGLNMYGAAIWDFYPDARQIFLPYHAHQLYLQNALDIGLPGLVAFLGLLVAFGYTATLALTRHRNGTEQALLLGLVGGVLSYLVYGLLDTLTLGAKPGAAFWAILGIAAAMARLAPSETPFQPAPSFWHSWKIATVSLGLIAGIVALGFLLSGRDPIGAFYLDLGTVKSHQLLSKLYRGEQADQEDLLQARNLLRRAEERGSASTHAFVLMGSLSGWLGDYPAAVEYLGPTVKEPGDQPAPIPWLVQFYQGVYGIDRPRQHGAPPVPGYLDMRHYTWMMERYPQRWEPYLKAAILLKRFERDEEQAIKVLEKGLQHTAWPGPLRYYLQQLE